MPTKKTSDNEQSNDVTTEGTDNADAQPSEAPSADTRSASELANEVLGGRFGDFNDVRDNLDKAGVNSSAVMKVVNDRLAHGAPAAYRPNVSQVLDSAQRGEWGDKHVGLRVRSAGFSEADALHVENSLNKDS